MEDKQKIISRNEFYYSSELDALNKRISELGAEREHLKKRVSELVSSLTSNHVSNTSELQKKASEYFFAGDVESAIEVLNENDLDSELKAVDKDINRVSGVLAQNIESWLLKARLFIINQEFQQASKAAERSYELTKRFYDLRADNNELKALVFLEQPGTIYYNIEEYGVALERFVDGYVICGNMIEREDMSCLPMLPLILQNIGACHYNTGDGQASISFLLEAEAWFCSVITIHEKEMGDFLHFQFMLLLVIANLATSYISIGELDEAHKAYKRGEEACDKLIEANNDAYVECLVRYLSGKGQLLFKKKEYSSSKETYSKLTPLLRTYLVNCNNTDAVILADTLRDQCACLFYCGDYDEATNVCEEALLVYADIPPTVDGSVEMHHVDTLVYMVMLAIQCGGSLKSVDEFVSKQYLCVRCIHRIKML